MNKFEIAVVHVDEPSIFKPLKFYCIRKRGWSGGAMVLGNF